MKAEEFRSLQFSLGLTNEGLAKRMGVKLNSIQRWRRDGCIGTPAVLIHMLAAKDDE